MALGSAKFHAVSDDNPGIGPRTHRKENVSAHYEEIGRTLSICEASCFKAGVIWLPPNKTVRSLRNKYEKPIENFIRYSLSTVNTDSLELYCDDLENLPFTDDSSQSLSLRILPLGERFAFCILVAIFIFIFCSLSAYWLKVGSITSMFGILIASLLAAAGSTVFCSEPQRRYSFYTLLNRELSRRRGTDQDEAGRIRMIPIETKPLSK